MMNQNRARHLREQTEAILRLRDEGFRVEQLTPYQFRIHDVLDLYPTRQRYHDIVRNERGDYLDPLTIATRIVRALQ